MRLADMACTCRVTGTCPTCIAWHRRILQDEEGRASEEAAGRAPVNVDLPAGSTREM